MSDWENEEAASKKVESSTFVRSKGNRPRQERSQRSTCESCYQKQPCQCPPVLPGTGHHDEDNRREGDAAASGYRRSDNIVCYGCKEKGHIFRNCPNPSQDQPTRKGPGRGKQMREENLEKDYVPKDEDLDELFDLKLGTGDNFQNYEKAKVEVSPSERAPAPLNTFKNSPFSPKLLSNIRKCGYECPTPVQRYAIPIVLEKSDLMSCAQTGSGKTAAFILPIIHSLMEKERPVPDSDAAAPRVLIVAPTRELVMQINNEARKFCLNLNIRCKVIYGGTSVGNCEKYLQNGPVDILAATPGRLLDMIDKEIITLKNIEAVILDEADRMLDMGFRPDIDNVFKHFSMPDMRKRQTLLFSATFPAEIQAMSSEYLRDYFFLKVGVVGGACEDIEQIVHNVKDYEKMDKLLTLLKGDHVAAKDSKILIFARKKKGVDFLATRLCLENHPATSIHGDRQQPQREEALRDFKRGIRPILVATEVASRGLDIPKVSTVINYDLPGDISTYVHRIGRSGRVGNKGKAISFYEADSDRSLAKELVDVLKGANQVVPDWLEKQGDVYYGGSRGSRSDRQDNSDIRKKKNGSEDNKATSELLKSKTEEEYWD